MCAKLVDPTPAGVACGYGPTPVAAPSLSAGHRPLRAARGCGPAVGADPGLSVGHKPLRAARCHSLAITVELRWTCGPHSSAGGQR